MSPGETNEAIGKLIQDYSANEKTLAAINSEIRDIRYMLRDISNDLEIPQNIKVSDNGDKVFLIGYQGDKHLNVSALDRLYTLITDYHTVKGKKNDMEVDLKQAGLENMIAK